jgi:predicted amidohydrolase YtcJ
MRDAPLIPDRRLTKKANRCFLFRSQREKRWAMAGETTIYRGGVVLTMDDEDNVADAVAVAGGRIIAVGSEADLIALGDERTALIDLRGRTLIPAFIDPHGHFPESGFCALHRVDLMCPPLGTVTTLDQVFERLADRAARTPKGEWVFGVFFDQTMVREKRFPTALELDQVSRDHALVVMHMCGHACVGNSAALRRAGVFRDTPQPKGGHIEKDPVTGEPTGLLEEPAAMGPISAAMFSTSGERFREGLRWAADEYASHGITSAQNAWASEPMLREFLAAAEDGEPKIRMTVLPDAHIEPDIRADLSISDPRHLKIGPRKLFSDGSIQIFTAYMSEPYHTAFRGDAGYRGYPIYEPADLAEHIFRLHQAGHQIHIHANGDAAADDVLQAFENAQERHPRTDHRHTIIHGQTLREDQLDKMAELGVSVSFFSYHVYVWGDRHRDLFLGPARARRISPAASATKRGIRYTLHNDTPVTPTRPLELIWCAVNRLTADGHVLGPEQCITPIQALRAHTIDAAWQVFREDDLGSIEVGKSADFALLSKNPLENPETIKDIDILATIKDGDVIFGQL